MAWAVLPVDGTRNGVDVMERNISLNELCMDGDKLGVAMIVKWIPTFFCLADP